MNELVCHCFGYTVRDIEQDLAAHGRSTLIERIAQLVREKKIQGIDFTFSYISFP